MSKHHTSPLRSIGGPRPESVRLNSSTLFETDHTQRINYNFWNCFINNWTVRLIGLLCSITYVLIKCIHVPNMSLDFLLTLNFRVSGTAICHSISGFGLRSVEKYTKWYCDLNAPRYVELSTLINNFHTARAPVCFSRVGEVMLKLIHEWESARSSSALAHRLYLAYIIS